MPKSAKRNIKLPASKPAQASPVNVAPVTATAVPASVTKPVPAIANATKAADRAIARDARYLTNARYTTDTVTPLTSAYLALFASAAKAGNGTFRTSSFNPLGTNNPENPKRNFRARAKLLADHGILKRTANDADAFTFTAAVTDKAAPANAPAHILSARSAYASAK